MGRGSSSTEYEGNLKLRQLVIDHREEYMSSKMRIHKHQIAQEIIQKVHDRGGRFLERITSLEEAAALNVPPGKQAWRVIHPSSPALTTKVKQLMRDVGAETQRKRALRREMQKQAPKAAPIQPTKAEKPTGTESHLAQGQKQPARADTQSGEFHSTRGIGPVMVAAAPQPTAGLTLGAARPAQFTSLETTTNFSADASSQYPAPIQRDFAPPNTSRNAGDPSSVNDDTTPRTPDNFPTAPSASPTLNQIGNPLVEELIRQLLAAMQSQALPQTQSTRFNSYQIQQPLLSDFVPPASPAPTHVVSQISEQELLALLLSSLQSGDTTILTLLCLVALMEQQNRQV